jgi:AcrR family transcriptional regulator
VTPGPAYSRLDVDVRRRQLLDVAERLFAEQGYDELSMADIARAAGISKALLYHYFPSKQELFRATLGEAAEELRERTEPDPSLPPLEQLAGSLDAFLSWIEERPDAYARLIRSIGIPEVAQIVDRVREPTAVRILDALFPDGAPPQARAAVRAWLWFMDGACLDWLEHRDFSREQLRNQLLGTLLGALTAADAAIEV